MCRKETFLSYQWHGIGVSHTWEKVKMCGHEAGYIIAGLVCSSPGQKSKFLL